MLVTLATCPPLLGHSKTPSAEVPSVLHPFQGLGKTAQVIALFAHLKEIGKAGPHLVIVPSSTLDNWIREFERFAPDMKVYAYYGTQAERADARFFLKQEKDLDVIVTTYNMATGAADDKKFLRKMDFKVRCPSFGALSQEGVCMEGLKRN